jgi:hypothetical protein
MTSTADFDALIEPYHEALGAIINGDPSGYQSIFSQRDDVTLGNPFGPFGRGRAEVEERLELAASKYSAGRSSEIARVNSSTASAYASPAVARSAARVANSTARSRSAAPPASQR